MKRDFAWLAACAALLLGCVVYTNHATSKMESRLRSAVFAAQAQSAEERIPVSECAVAIDENLLRQELRAALQSVDIKTSDASGPDASPDFEPASNDAPLDAEAIVAFDEANKLIDSALHTEEWTAEHRHAFLPLLGRLDDQSRNQLMNRLFRAIETKELESDAPPLDPM